LLPFPDKTREEYVSEEGLFAPLFIIIYSLFLKERRTKG